MVLGNTVPKLETFVWILSHISMSITWSLFNQKASYSVKWSISIWSFMFIDWLKFETHPSSLLNFGTAYDDCSYILDDTFFLESLTPTKREDKQHSDMISFLIIHQIFLVTCDWSKFIMWLNIPQQKLGNIWD